MGRGGALPPMAGTGRIYGSYIHGVFDAPGVADGVLRAVCREKGVDFAALGSFDMGQYKELQYDRLAAGVRAGLDMDLVYRIIERKI